MLGFGWASVGRRYVECEYKYEHEYGYEYECEYDCVYK